MRDFDFEMEVLYIPVVVYVMDIDRIKADPINATSRLEYYGGWDYSYAVFDENGDEVFPSAIGHKLIKDEIQKQLEKRHVEPDDEVL